MGGPGWGGGGRGGGEFIRSVIVAAEARSISTPSKRQSDRSTRATSSSGSQKYTGSPCNAPGRQSMWYPQAG